MKSEPLHAAADGASSSARQLTTLDCVGIGINGIIGSGIFLLPAAVYRHAGGHAPLSWLLCGALCFLVGLCFAEAATTTDRSGGPYAYATRAFGSEVGYAVGFVALASTVLGYATVARGFSEQLTFFGDGFRGHEAAVGAVIVTLLALTNLAGVKPAAWTSDAFSVAKLLPLAVFAVAGLFVIHPALLSAPPTPHAGEAPGLVAGAMAGLFACTGFEYVSVPAGETKNPARAVPLALLGSLAAAILLYALVQLVAGGITDKLGDSSHAITDAARIAFGPAFGSLIALGALVSMFGFCSGSALVGPAYLAAFADGGMAPRVLAVRRENGSPVFAVGAFSLAAIVLASSGSFEKLADVANIACVLQYVATAASVLALRKKGVAATFRLPGGAAIPLLALVGCFVFLREVKLSEAILCGEVLAVGFGMRLGLLAIRRFTAKAPA